MANTTGKKFGGRVKGTPNKDKEEILDLIKKTGCRHPIEGLAVVAKEAHDTQELDLAHRCYKELAQYVAAKRKAIEHSGEVDTREPLVIVMPADD